jgi:pimeloyl-ACP methyl ester carboxylesterase
MWRRQVQALGSEYHLLVPDLPEQGQSAEIGPFSVEFAAECAADLIRQHAHGGKASVVGLSEGAQIAVAMLSKCPALIDHAVVSSAILRPMPMAWIYTRGMFTWSYRWFMKPFRNNNGWIRLNMRSSAGVSDEYWEDFRRTFRETTESGFVNLMLAAMTFRMPAGLENASVPTLVAAGSREYKQMIESARDLLAVLPRSRGILVDLGKKATLASEHSWAMTAPDLFNAAVKAWIEDRPLPEELKSLN